MDPAGFPTPPPECLPDDVAAASDACGAVMLQYCSGPATNTTGGSALQQYDSNCNTWMTAVQAASTAAVAPCGGQPFLDAAMVAYCDAYPTDPNCACLAFPRVASAFCDASTCPNKGTMCPLTEIAQSNGPGAQPDDALSVLQFGDNCNPYPCWLDACYQTHALLTSELATVQLTPGGCAPWCVETEGVASYSFNVPPLAPGSWNVEGGGLITKCSAEATEPLPFIPPVALTWAANSLMRWPLAVSNIGDFPLILSVTGVDTPWANLYPPTNFVVSGRTTRPLLFTADQATLNQYRLASPGGSLSTASTLSFAYADSQGQAHTYEAVLDINVLPPQPPIIVQTNNIPASFWGTAAMAAAALVALVLLTSRDRKFVLHETKRMHLADAAARRKHPAGHTRR
jgi:hypothetical protein